ncbi:MAG: hypothetical protein M1825_003684 [Sarcosagium campestre]|nr:MAG: hypothetical protein M1825_003684 [Sarcosagium campestre]
MVSPRHSPKRRPLHERSDSHTNELNARTQTIRIVHSPNDDDVYASSPFPTLPSHVLSPSLPSVSNAESLRHTHADDHEDGPHDYRTEQDRLEHQPDNVSGGPATSESSPKSTNSPKFPDRVKIHAAEQPPSLSTKPTEGNDKISPTPIHVATPQDDKPGVACPTQVLVPSEGNKPEQSNLLRTGAQCLPRALPGSLSGDAPNGSPSVSSLPQSHEKRSTFNTPPPSQNRPELDAGPQPSLLDPELEFSGVSDDEADDDDVTVIVMSSTPHSESSRTQSHPDGPRRPSTTYSAFPPSLPPTPPPRLKSKSPNHLKPILKKRTDPKTPTGPSSQISSEGPSTPVPSIPRELASSEGTVRYPIIRAPVARKSWADSSLLAGKERATASSAPTPHPLREHAVQSTVAPPRTGQVPQHGGQIGSFSSSTRAEAPSSSSPGPSQRSQQHTSMSATIRHVSNPDDLGESPVESRRMSAFFADNDETGKRTDEQDIYARLAKRGSLKAGGVPTWARTYYGSKGKIGSDPSTPLSDKRANRHTMPDRPDRRGSPGSSTEEFEESGVSSSPPGTVDLPLGIYRPRNRPHTINIPQRQTRFASTDNLADGDNEDDFTARGIPRGRLTEPWSPRLRTDRRSARLSVWSAPPVQEKVTDGIFTRRRMQILLFCIGFILPIAWMVGAFLPLPMNPSMMDEKRNAKEPSFAEALSIYVRSADEARYENARWWRNVNRIMSIVGLILIGAVIALVVVAIRMRNSSVFI